MVSFTFTVNKVNLLYKKKCAGKGNCETILFPVKEEIKINIYVLLIFIVRSIVKQFFPCKREKLNS